MGTQYQEVRQETTYSVISGLPTSYLVIGVRGKQKVRLERRHAKGAFEALARLRALGWAGCVKVPGTWAEKQS